MSGEIQFNFQTGRTCYVLVRNRNAQSWSTSGGTGGFENYLTADYASYPISVTEQGTATGYYAGDFPTAAPAGTYSVTGKQQTSASPAETDPTVCAGNMEWNGSTLAPLSDTATSGLIGQFLPIRIFRGQMVKPFLLDLVGSADHLTPFTSGVVSGQISRDGGAFGALQSGAFTEVGLGWYSLQALTSGDLLANAVALVFTGQGVSGGACDPRRYALYPQRTSGQ